MDIDISLIINAAVALISAFLSASGMWAYIGKRLDRQIDAAVEQEHNRNAERQMLIGLAHDRIVWLGMQYIERGYITRDEYENLNDYLFEPYESIGGNGSAAKVMKEVRQLPLHK